MKILLILINLAFAQVPQYHYTNRQYEDENANVTIDDINKIKAKVQDEHDVLEAGDIDASEEGESASQYEEVQY